MIERLRRLLRPKKVLHPRLRCPGYLGRHAGRTALVLGTGPTLVANRDKILEFIRTHEVLVLGAQHFFPLHGRDTYSVYTYGCHYIGFSNRRRFCTYGRDADRVARYGLLVAPHIPTWLVRQHTGQWPVADGVKEPCWERMPFVNDNDAPFAVDHGIIQSACGQTGALLLAVAFVMGCSRIYAAGLDGYSDPDNWHAYGGTEGKSDANFAKCVQLSKIVAKRLAEMRTVFAANGVEGPTIITPTTYSEFYQAP